MPVIRSIPLGGVDVSGQPLPQQAQYIAPGGQPVIGGPDTGNWEPYVPPQQAPGSLPVPQQAGPTGNWQPYQAPAQPYYVSPVDPGYGGAAAAGFIHGATYGTAPMIQGIAAAPEAQDAEDRARVYAETRDKALKEYQETQRQYPWTTLGGEALGGLLATPALGPLGTLGAATKLGRIAQGVKVGATTGGLFGAGEAGSRGETPEQALWETGKGAVAGGVAGGAFGGTIEGGASLWNKIQSLRRGKFDPTAEASAIIQDAFQGPGARAYERTRADVQNLIQSGADYEAPMTVGDWGGRVTGKLLRTAADVSPEAADLIDEQLNQRYRLQSTRVGDWIQSKFGGADTELVQERLKELARKFNKPKYERAYVEGDREITSDELERLSSAPMVQDAIEKAIKNWKNAAVSDGFGAFNPRFRVENGQLINSGTGLKTFPNVQLWDYVGRQLQDAAREAPAGSNQARQLNNFARGIKSEVDAQVSAFKDAREGAATFFGAQDALEAGRRFVDGRGADGRSLSLSASAREIAKMNPAEKKLFAQGFANEVTDRLDRTKFSSDILNQINNSRAAQTRINLALGPDAARQFDAVTRVESIMEKMKRAALANSQTSGNLMSLFKAGGAIGGIRELIHSFNPAYIIGGALYLGGRQMAQRIDEQVYTRVAEMLLSKDPSVLNRGYDIISKNPYLREALRRASDLSVRELVSVFGPSNVLAGEATIGGRIPVLGRWLGGQPEETPKAYSPQEQDQGRPMVVPQNP